MTFVLTGPTKRLMEFEDKAKIISNGSSKSIKTLARRLHRGRKGIVYQHDPRHVDVFTKDLGLENMATPCRHQQHLMQQKKKSRNR